MNDKKQNNESILDIKSTILDSIRQFCFPKEFRIAPPSLPLDALETVEAKAQPVPEVVSGEQQSGPRDLVASKQLVVELATCLWYLKTKYFKRAWDDAETGDEDPRVRRALSRLNKSIETLKERGIEVQDPINKRYPQGGEGMMRPIQLLPTDGLTFEVVSETVIPIIYLDERLIQRGEVFVAVPKADSVSVDESIKAPSSPEPDTVDAERGTAPYNTVSQAKTFSEEADSHSVELAAGEEESCSDGDVSPQDIGIEVEEPEALIGGEEDAAEKFNELESACVMEDSTAETPGNSEEGSQQGTKTHND